VFGLPAKWVPIEMRRQAEAIGATIVDRSAVVTTHLAEIVRRNAGALLGRQDVKALLDIVRETAPAVIDDLLSLQVSNAEIQRVLQDLLDEGVGIRDLVRILEAIGERARQTRDPEALVNAARGALGPAISSALATAGRLPVITISPTRDHLRSSQARRRGPFSRPGTGSPSPTARRRGRSLTTAASTALVCGAPYAPASRLMARTHNRSP
jgi:flagellar biosynthesis protein FlhA